VKPAATTELSKVNVVSRTKRLLLFRAQEMMSSNSLSTYASTSLPQAEINDSRHLNATTKTTRSSAIAEGPRDALCQLKSCQLPRNSAGTTYTTSPDRSDGMKLEI